MDKPTEFFTNQLRMEMGSWSTLEIRVHESQDVNLDRVRDPYVAIATRYIDAGGGKRCLEHLFTTASGLKKRVANYDDGSKCARVFYDASTEHQTQIAISHDFASENRSSTPPCPRPLNVFYIDKTPLSDALSRAERLGRSTVIGRPCEQFLFPNVNVPNYPEDAVYHLDEETAVPLKVEYYTAGSPREPRNMVGLWQAKSLDPVEGGRHFPLTSMKESYARGSGQGHVTITTEAVVETLAYDRDYPASTFWPKYEPGVKVIDSLTHKTTEVPGPKRELNAMGRQPSLTSTPGTAEPATPVEQPRGWMSFLPAVVLIAGLALIVSAFVLRRRGG